MWVSSGFSPILGLIEKIKLGPAQCEYKEQIKFHF